MAYGLYVISLGTGLSCSHHPRDHPASLTPASGCQDHTTSPSASVPFVRTIARTRRQSVHRIPASRVVTIAIRPSDEDGTALIMLPIWGEVKRCSEKQNASAATEWRDGQFAHGNHARSARRADCRMGRLRERRWWVTPSAFFCRMSNGPSCPGGGLISDRRLDVVRACSGEERSRNPPLRTKREPRGRARCA